MAYKQRHILYGHSLKNKLSENDAMYRPSPMRLIALLLFATPPALFADLQLNFVSSRTEVVDIANAGDGSDRLFLVEQPGRIFVLRGGSELPNPFLDIRSRVRSTGNEQGLLSVAFAPDFRVSGIFYVWYTDLAGDSVLERFRVSGNPDVADADSGEVILEVPQPFSNHNGGRLRFGPDGMLFLGLGDGGGTFDPQGNGQFGGTLLGKLIRIDVDPVHGNYAIPPDNPFSESDSVLDEVWALGLRNPWRISFDVQSGDLYIADVGQAQTEEVNFQTGDSHGGQNYGWSVMEGSQCVSGGCDQSGLTLPIAEYSHNVGCSITGGEVYRGMSYPGLRGTYLFADFCSGRIWGLNQSGGQWQMDELLDSSLQITTFGLGEDRSLYLAGRNSGIYLLSDGPVQPEPEFRINAGLNDSWFNPATPGQGFFITVYPEIEQVFLAWFTYDTQRPPANIQSILGEPGHRWLTAFGPFEGDTATLGIELTQGGIFDMTHPVPDQGSDGTIFLQFDGCGQGRVIYEIPSIGNRGWIPIERIGLDNVSRCEALQ